MRLIIPPVEIADDVYFARRRSPHAEGGSGLAAHVHHVRSQLFVNAVMAALVKQVEVLIRQEAEIVTSWSCGRHHRVHARKMRGGLIVYRIVYRTFAWSFAAITVAALWLMPDLLTHALLLFPLAGLALIHALVPPPAC